nr:MAG TPA: PolyVal ADP-Ribosyltransferase [Caudoviricetes sp.]
MLRANAIGKVKEPEENTARSRILSRAAQMGEVKPAEAAPKYAEETTREPYSIAALGAGNYGADKQANEGYNYGKGLLKAGGMGLSAIARDVTTPLALGERTVAKGWNALFGNIAPMNERGFFNAWDENIALEQEGLQQRYAENTAKGGQYAEKGENLLASAVETLPSLVIALATGGTSAAAKAGDLAAQTAAKSSPALVQTLKNVAAARAKDPNYLASAAQIFSHSYNDAKTEGVDDKRAALYAIGNALLGSEIEISGGIQNLPGKVANQAAWRTLVNTMLDEGKEEVLQGIIDRTLQNAVYDADNPYFGVNENAIFDPGTAAEEFAGGAIVGGLLSGGTMGVSAIANRVAYDAAKAQYNRDVQRNTAPEINTKAAEAVEAVTRGETITGNQAAAIARDPVAVEVLEQRTGVKLDTDKPISQVKRDIAGLASREVTQETHRATTPSPIAQKRAEKRVGGFLENGQKAYQEMSRTAEDAPSLYAGFSSVYNAGLNGIEADKAKGKYAAMLTPEQRYAAYNAGLEDARVQLARENAEVASVTTTAGAGLADNEYSRGLIAAKKDTAATLNAWGKKLGVRIEIVDHVLGGKANGQYIKEQNLIQIAADSDKPLLNVTAHEITHRMQDLSPAEYRKFRQAAVEYKMQENGADTEAEIVERYMEAAEQEGVTLTRDEVMDELAADFAGDMLDDADLFAKFSKENRTAAQKLLDSLKEFLAKVKTAFTGKYRDMAAQEAYGKDFAELEDIAKQWQAAFDAAERQTEKTKTAASDGDGAKYQIKQFPNGMKYVQADRQVLFGNDPKAWSEQLESYINGKIRNHEDVRLIAEDGDVLLLTSKSAGKLSSIYDNNGRTLDEKAFERKANAAAHIDELIKVSERGGKTVLDFGGRHGDMAKDGWNYRTAYFMDFDGKYYRTRISVALGKDGSIVYNIGEMQERSTPQINGSSGNSGAQRGNASGTSILTDGENVKPQFSLKSTDSTGRKLSEQQQEFFKDSKVQDAEGRLLTVYHGTDAEFTVFDPDKIEQNYPLRGGDLGFYFTPYKEDAQGYAGNASGKLGGGHVMEAYLNLRNPLIVEDSGWGSAAGQADVRHSDLKRWAKDGGHDGIIVRSTDEIMDDNGTPDTVYIAFSPEQIKRVDNPNPTSDPDIRFSLKAYSEAEKKDHVKSAKEFFGKTYSWNETGYITTDGTKLDFSGRHDGGPGGYRTVDHRDIRDALGLDYGGDDYSGAMVQFMGEGNIRISPESGGINLSVMPTKAQFDSLADFISKNRGEVILDLDDANGNTVSSTEYPKGTHSSKVINDIKAYFENGTTPYVSELGKFRYQLKNTAEVEREARELKKERNALAKQNEALKQRVQELKGEMRISKEPSVVARDVKKLGQNLIREYGSDVKYADVQSEMDALAKAVMKRDVTMEDLMPHAKAVAEAIVDNTSELTEYGAELLEIRDHLKRQTIQFSGDMANYGDFRKNHMGTLKLNKDNGTSVDTVYGELTEMFGEGYFPSDVYTEADKLLQIGDVLDGLDSVYHNPFEGYRDAAVQEIANQLIDGMISDQVRQKKTYADRRALEKQEAVGRVREMLSRERQKRRDDVNALRKKYNEKTKRGSEKRKATAMRARIARHTGAISRKLVNPTDKQHIPERLRVAVASLLQNINLESAYSYDENGRLRKNADGDPTRRTLEADRLKQIYDDILTNEGNMVVDPALTESGGLLDSLSALGSKRIADMSVSELESVWNAIRAIETTLTTYDKTLSSAKYKSTSEWAERFAADSMGRQRRNRKISLDMADPYTFFSAYGEAGKQLYRTLRNAQDQQHWMLRDVQREAEKFLDKDVYKNRFDRHTFTTGRGVELTLTTDQIMNLYNLARRGEQAMHHLTVGGIVQPEIKRDGKLKEIPRGNDNILLTEEDIKAITAVLTPEQVKVANGLQKLASTKLAEWGNNASMQVYGYRKFKEEHYWPIKAAKDAVASSVEKDADNARSIKNMGSAKALTPNASNALDIGGAYDLFAQNASDMIKYATLLAPMEDINRLYNYRYRDSSGNLTGRNMQQVLSGVYGDAAQKYWRNLMRDMQNGMVKNSSDTTRSIERIVGNTKGAAVGSNWRVVIQQPTAFFRAAVILDPENMAKGIAKGVTDGNGWDKARNWAAIAGIKDSSGFDQGSRYTIAREVYGSSDSVMDKLSDWSSRAAANADAITWGKIWNACEWQVAADTKTEVGSDAYYRQVAELFTDVIDQTQVVDGIMQRTQIMRDSDALTRQATSFMGEPLKSLNILMRSYDAWRFETNTQKRSAALKQLKRSVGALLVTDLINSLAQSLVDALRDDDKEKKYWARFFAALTGVSGDEESFGELAKNVLLEGNLKGNITLVGRLPYAKDLISILQGYSVERMDADAIGDIVRATQTMYSSVTGEGKYTTAYACKQLLTAVSKIFGVSVANLGRDVWAAARSTANETGSVRIMFEMEKAIYRMDRSAGNRKRWCELLYLAQKENDTKTARMIYNEMLEHGYDEEGVRQGVEAIMKNEQGVGSVKELKNRWRAP